MIISIVFTLLFFILYYKLYWDVIVFKGNKYLIVWYTYEGVKKYKILLKL